MSKQWSDHFADSQPGLTYNSQRRSSAGVTHSRLRYRRATITLDLAPAAFTEILVLVDGKITAFMGFNFIVTTRLTTASGDRLCAAWAQSGMALGIWNDITTKISERADKSYATQVYCKVTCGATRVEQGKVIRVICDEP